MRPPFVGAGPCACPPDGCLQNTAGAHRGTLLHRRDRERPDAGDGVVCGGRPYGVSSGEPAKESSGAEWERRRRKYAIRGNGEDLEKVASNRSEAGAYQNIAFSIAPPCARCNAAASFYYYVNSASWGYSASSEPLPLPIS